MAVKISGVLKDGAGKPVQNCTIQLKAKRNSTTVVVNTVASENPDAHATDAADSARAASTSAGQAASSAQSASSSAGTASTKATEAS
ncbi:hypothetical protein FCX31_24995, partial [Escherichia coli]|nr:hypothetical protein [Escherichia coli]